jgi:hypothetical protein
MLMVPSGSPPQLATSFVKSNISRDVGYWHIASLRYAAKFGRYWGHSGHRKLPLEG